jgi:hypothetical protein
MTMRFGYHRQISGRGQRVVSGVLALVRVTSTAPHLTAATPLAAAAWYSRSHSTIQLVMPHTNATGR